MLLGERNEKRAAERLVQNAMKFLNPIFIGSLRKYRAIHGKTVAAAMINVVKGNKIGFFRYTYDEIIKLADQRASYPG
jgi:hypothetical protein